MDGRPAAVQAHPMRSPSSIALTPSCAKAGGPSWAVPKVHVPTRPAPEAGLYRRGPRGKPSVSGICERSRSGVRSDR